jgi:hypothetical protein
MTQSRRDGCVIASSEGIDGCPTFAKAYVGRKPWAKPNDRFSLMEDQLAANRRVPHISLVFREMWDTTAFDLRILEA